MAKSSPSKEIVSSPRQDSEMNDESQDSSMLRDATQNDPQVFDMVKSPDPPSKNMEEESVSRGELQFRKIFNDLNFYL